MLFNDEILDEDAMFCMFSELNRKNPPFPRSKWTTCHLQKSNLSLDLVTQKLPLLGEALQIPQYFVCSNGTVASGMEGLLMLLKRFAYPCRLSDMIPRFGRSVPEISLILAEVTDHIYRTNGHLLQDLIQPWLEPQQLESFARAIHRRGAALSNCWGFVDYLSPW